MQLLVQRHACSSGSSPGCFVPSNPLPHQVGGCIAVVDASCPAVPEALPHAFRGGLLCTAKRVTNEVQLLPTSIRLSRYVCANIHACLAARPPHTCRAQPPRARFKQRRRFLAGGCIVHHRRAAWIAKKQHAALCLPGSSGWLGGTSKGEEGKPAPAPLGRRAAAQQAASWPNTRALRGGLNPFPCCTITLTTPNQAPAAAAAVAGQYGCDSLRCGRRRLQRAAPDCPGSEAAASARLCGRNRCPLGLLGTALG